MVTKLPLTLKPVKQSYIENFEKYSLTQLEELHNRQKHLLSNKNRLSKLPDKGKRIQLLFDRLIEEIASRDDINRAANLFSELNIASKGKAVTTNMEWSGKLTDPSCTDAIVSNTDDLEETDPIKLLAQSRSTKKLIEVIEPETSLITSADLEEIHSFKIENSPVIDETELEPHALNMCDIEHRHLEKEKYLPHKTTKSNVHTTEKEKLRKCGKHWENTAATPPRIRNSEVKMLSLQDSIALQREQNKLLKEIEQKHAVERLMARNSLASKIMDSTHISLNNPTEFFKSYRNVAVLDSDDDEDVSEEFDSDQEVHDTDDEPRGGVNIEIYE